MWSIQRRSNTAALSAPAVVQLLDKWSWGTVHTQHPSLCCEDAQGALSPSGWAIAEVRAVLPLIWKYTGQYFEVASQQGRWGDAALTLLALFFLVS